MNTDTSRPAPSRRRPLERRTRAARRAAAGLALGAVIAGDAGMASAALAPQSPGFAPVEARHLQDAAGEWLGLAPGAVVANNQIVQINLKVNANSSDGSRRELPTSARVTLTNGVFPASTSAIPGVRVAEDRKTADVDFGRVPGGGARQLALDVMAYGDAGSELSAVVTPNVAAPIRLPALRVNAVSSAGLTLAGGGYHWGMAKGTRDESVDTHVGLSVPSNGAPLAPRMSFELSAEGPEGDEFELLRPDPADPVLFTGHGPFPHGLPARPAVKVVKDEKARVFRVTVDGLTPPETEKGGPAGQAAGTGSEGVRWLSAFRLRFKYANADRRAEKRDKEYEVRLTAKNVEFRTAAGDPVAETSHGNATTTHRGTSSPGTVGVQYLPLSVPELVPDERNAALTMRKGSGWLEAQPGDQAIVVAKSGLNRHTTPQTAGQRTAVTMYLPIDTGYTRFAGDKIGVMRSGSPIAFYERRNLPPFIKWSTDPVTSYTADLSALRYTSGGAMPDNATVVALENPPEAYRSVTNPAPDPHLRVDNLYVPVEFTADRLNRDFDGRVLLPVGFQIGSGAGAARADGEFRRPSVTGVTASLTAPVGRHPEVTGRTYTLDIVNLSPFHTASTVTSSKERLNAGESADIELGDGAVSRHPSLAPNRNDPHRLKGTAVFPATLEVDRSSLPQGAELRTAEDGTTSLSYEVQAKANTPAVTKVRVKAKTNGAVAHIRHTTQNVSAFVNQKLDSMSASSSLELPLAGVNATVLEKRPFAESMAFDGENAWVIEERNQTAGTADRVAVVDILPYNGDQNGTRFSGTALSTKPVTAGPGVRVLYTDADPATLERDPAAESNAGRSLDSPASHWKDDVPPSGYTGVLLLAEGQKSGSALTASIPFKAAGNLPGDRYDNTAWARSGTGGVNTELKMIRSAQAVSPKEAAVLQIHKRPAEGAQPRAGQEIAYEIVVRNGGTTPATDVSVTDHGGGGIDPASIRIEGADAASPARLEIGTLAAGETRTLQATALILPGHEGKEASNRVTVENPRHPAAPDPASCTPNLTAESDTDGCDVSTLPVPTAARLHIDKSVTASGPHTPGHEAEFTVRVRNSGQTSAENVTVTEHGGENLDPATIAWGAAPEGTTVTGERWLIPSLKAGETKEIRVRARTRVPNGAGTSETAARNRVSVDSPSVPRPNGDDPATRTCTPNADLDSDGDACDEESIPLAAPALAVTPPSPQATATGPLPPNEPDEPTPLLLSTGHAGAAGGAAPGGLIGAAVSAAVLAAMAGALAVIRPFRMKSERTDS
ncbi:DUF11 domain-containing protein [Arthrobacter sp. UM1]|uniref:DUF11 domain-containing protein n=1 Tax=Arthrobacter sp. UM1 TaxID=2766776 RepID=UPI001CF652D6|nr:DUF11 domain-containing protein [Arthrobacter sp. UM1]MCB4207355.1 DUF11 domain-containing protein [Arthrobacter sp. UM1]